MISPPSPPLPHYVWVSYAYDRALASGLVLAGPAFDGMMRMRKLTTTAVEAHARITIPVTAITVELSSEAYTPNYAEGSVYT